MYRPSELHFMSDTLLMISLKNDFDPYSSNKISLDTIINCA